VGPGDHYRHRCLLLPGGLDSAAAWRLGGMLSLPMLSVNGEHHFLPPATYLCAPLDGVALAPRGRLVVLCCGGCCLLLAKTGQRCGGLYT